jgi:hypothetical protein
LGVWIVLEITGVEEPVEPQLLGLVASAIGMVLGSLLSPKIPHGQERDSP